MGKNVGGVFFLVIWMNLVLNRYIFKSLTMIHCFQIREKYKINSVYPSKHQILHDASYTLFASFLASVIEIWLCHAWSMGWISYESDTNILKNVLIGSFVFLWRAPHFHLIHRLIHPWRTVYFPGTNLIFSIQSVD